MPSQPQSRVRAAASSGDTITTQGLLDSERGRISRILLAVSSYGAQTFGSAIQSVLSGLPREARLDILVSASALDTVSEWLRAAGPGETACLIEAPDELAFSLWTQDLFLARANGEVEFPPQFQRYQDLQAAKVLTSGAELNTHAANIYFEGGNVLAAGNWVLIGEDVALQNQVDPDVLVSAIDPGRRPIILGTELGDAHEVTRATDRPAHGWKETLHWRMPDGSRQPLFHLDLFIAPAGTGESGQPRFLVGCPRRGASALGHPVLPQALADAFDRIAGQLVEAGAQVIRNPMPLIWKDDPDKQERLWFHLPVNNVLVENLGHERKTVWLPCFASEHWPELQEIDNANAAIWALLGYSVIRIPGLMPLAENLGALHCMAKVVERR